MLLQTWWNDRSLSPFVGITGANLEGVVMQLVPFNRHLRIVDGTVLNPVAIALAYKAALKWTGGKDDPLVPYIGQLSLVLSCVPPSWSDTTVVIRGGVVRRSHYPGELSRQLDRFVSSVRSHIGFAGGWGRPWLR